MFFCCKKTTYKRSKLNFLLLGQLVFKLYVTVNFVLIENAGILRLCSVTSVARPASIFVTNTRKCCRTSAGSATECKHVGRFSISLKFTIQILLIIQNQRQAILRRANYHYFRVLRFCQFQSGFNSAHF